MSTVTQRTLTQLAPFPREQNLGCQHAEGRTFSLHFVVVNTKHPTVTKCLCTVTASVLFLTHKHFIFHSKKKKSFNKRNVTGEARYRKKTHILEERNSKETRLYPVKGSTSASRLTRSIASTGRRWWARKSTCKWPFTLYPISSVASLQVCQAPQARSLP